MATDRDMHLSEQDVDERFDQIVTDIRAPKLRRATSAWSSLGEDYDDLPPQSLS
ncbi:MAG: hypothetical protein ACRD12_22645 [Acidimicrobiales bacterium]